MGEYKNIERIETLDEWNTNLFLRGNKYAAIQITKHEDKFLAAIYHLFTGDPYGEEPKKKKSLMAQIYHDGSKEALLEAIGWVDENPAEFVEWKEAGAIHRQTSAKKKTGSAAVRKIKKTEKRGE